MGAFTLPTPVYKTSYSFNLPCVSASRAQTIKNMLINKGFDGNNIEVFGKGDLEPLQEAEEFGEAVNRRVEVFFISN